MVWSQYLYLLTGMACNTLRPTRYFMNTMLTSPTSIALDCDRKRFNKSTFSVACILIVKPRSLVACSPIFGIAATGGPAWSRVMSLISCAQIIGNPASTPDPAESPANAALPLSKPRRETLCLCGPNFFVDIHHSLSLYLAERLSLATTLPG